MFPPRNSPCSSPAFWCLPPTWVICIRLFGSFVFTLEMASCFDLTWPVMENEMFFLSSKTKFGCFPSKSQILKKCFSFFNEFLVIWRIFSTRRECRMGRWWPHLNYRTPFMKTTSHKNMRDMSWLTRLLGHLGSFIFSPCFSLKFGIGCIFQS